MQPMQEDKRYGHICRRKNFLENSNFKDALGDQVKFNATCQCDTVAERRRRKEEAQAVEQLIGLRRYLPGVPSW